MSEAKTVVVVTGGRDYTNRKYLETQLDALDPDHIIHGGAEGADGLASLWAFKQDVKRRREVSQQCFMADWATYGNSAGPRRNAEMAAFAAKLAASGANVTVVAFPGGRGTANMVSAATKRGLKVLDLRNVPEAA